VPVIISKVDYYRYKHGEGLVLVSFEDVEEVVIFKETHSPVSYLQVDSSNASHNPLEELGNEMFNFVDFTHFKHFLQFCQKESFLDAVSERPVFEQSFQKWNSQGSVFRQEKHRASEQLFIKL